MPDDNRLDLNSDLEKVSKDFLKDVEAAASEVKQRKAADRERDLKVATRAKERKVSMAIIAGAALLLIALAWWLVFARQPEAAEPIRPPVTVANPKLNPPVNRPAVPRPHPQRNQQGDQQYEQHPYGDDMPGQ
ncbi:MAG: hypothetical protein ACOX3G_12085 [Armatimonadota bacterium]|jgi:hypothetical protein